MPVSSPNAWYQLTSSGRSPGSASLPLPGTSGTLSVPSRKSRSETTRDGVPSRRVASPVTSSGPTNMGSRPSSAFTSGATASTGTANRPAGCGGVWKTAPRTSPSTVHQPNTGSRTGVPARRLARTVSGTVLRTGSPSRNGSATAAYSSADEVKVHMPAHGVRRAASRSTRFQAAASR
ncbi:hypothetical protein [Nonomuraea rubra]|uniref:hypothetical protein n=1 Tax=Nonomuraea rubra TaxID=46180 RepID=UPI0031EC387B